VTKNEPVLFGMCIFFDYRKLSGFVVMSGYYQNTNDNPVDVFYVKYAIFLLINKLSNIDLN